ncbi:MAG: hypothetical protein ACE5HI_15960 [bacterium]
MKNKQHIPVLIAEIHDELSKLNKLVDKLAKQKQLDKDEESLDSAALRLHNFYTGCERIFKLIASDVNDYVPDSWDWHKRLLTQMSLELEGIRPAVISEIVRNDLQELLAFRHIVRNIYGYELDQKRVEHLVTLTKATFPNFVNDIKKFIEYLRDLLKEL